MFINMDSKEQNNCSKNANMRGIWVKDMWEFLGFILGTFLQIWNQNKT